MYTNTLNGAALPVNISSSNLQTGLRNSGWATVCGIIQETSDTRSLLLQRHDGTFNYQAGQYLIVEIPFESAIQRRCYSFSSAPEIDARPMVTVKRVAGGVVSNWLHDNITIGSKLRVSAPGGVFTLKPESPSTLQLFGAGSGITPLMSLLKTALFHSARAVQLFYANRSPADTVFAEQLDLLKIQHRERFQVIYHYDDRDGFPSERAITEALRAPASGEIYLCGPSPFVALVERCAQLVVPSAALYVERFSASGGASAASAIVAEVIDASVEWVVADRETWRFRCSASETLLEAARRAGYDPPSSCEEGYCGSCVAKLVSGQVQMRASDALNARKRREGLILPCQARALVPQIKLTTGGAE